MPPMDKIDADKAARVVEKPTAYIKKNYSTSNLEYLIKDPDYDPESHITLDNIKFCK
jgi:hypothetical protein